MGFRFRKSKNFGPFRINLSKSGVGYSVGTKGFRLTKKASGGVRATVSPPGTGLSYSKDFSAKQSAKEDASGAGTADEEGAKKKGGCLKPVLILLAVLLGIGLIASLAGQNTPEETEPSAIAAVSATEPSATDPPATVAPTQPLTEPAPAVTAPEEAETAVTQPETVPPETTPAAATEPAEETGAEAEEPQIIFLSWPETIGRGETGTVKIQGVPNTEYSITVQYKSGPSTASGLEPKTSGADGCVSWSWKVGGRTSAGTFTITVSGGGVSESVQFTVTA